MAHGNRIEQRRSLGASGVRVARSRQRLHAFTTVVCATAAVFCTPAFGAEQSFNTFEFTPYVGYVVGGEFEDPVDSTDRDVDEDTSWGLIFNIAADEWRHYEFLFANQSSQVEGVEPFDIDIQYLQIGGTVSSPDAERVIPYFGMTVGGARFNPDLAVLDDETKVAFSVAGGFKIPITDHIGVRFDARAFITLLDSDGDFFCASSGGAATCRIRAKSDTLLQYSAALGVVIGF
jgi:Outer membrane protein beta-barrel domain